MNQRKLVSIDYWEDIRPIKNYRVTDDKLFFFIKDCLFFSSLQYELFFKIFPKYLSKNSSVIEIGSGPGRNLALISRIIGCKVSGIENSKSRCKENEKYFLANRIPKNRLIKANFLEYEPKEKFDAVLSFGFIEHFSNPDQIINKHLAYLKKGGVLICAIPNFTGLNSRIQKIFDEKNLECHNTELMRLENYCASFKTLNKVFCGYFGAYSLRIFKIKSMPLRVLIMPLKIIRPLVNAILIICAAFSIRVQTPLSPYLLYIGRKR